MFGNPDYGSRQEWDKANGVPSFKLRVLTGEGYMQSSRMPYALAELGQQDLKEKKIAATIIFDPE